MKRRKGLELAAIVLAGLLLLALVAFHGAAQPANFRSMGYDPLFDRADQPCNVAVTPDGNTLYVTANKSHNVFVIDVASRQVLDCIDPTKRGTVDVLVDEIAITPDGNWAVITNPVWYQEFSGSATILDLSDNSIVDTIYFLNGSASQPQVSPDSNTVYIASDCPPRVFVVDIPALSIITTIDLSNPTTNLHTFVIALSLAGNTLYAIGPCGSPDYSRLVLIDTNTYTISQVIDLPIPDVINFSYVAVAPDGNQLYVVHGENRKLYVLDLLNNAALLAEIDFPQEEQMIMTIEFSVDGSYAYVGGYTPGGIYVIDTATYTVIQHIMDFPSGITGSELQALDIAPDGSLLFAVAPNDDAVFFIDTATHELDTYINLNPIQVWPMQIALSNDGRWLYTSGIEYSLEGQGRVYVIDTGIRAVVEHIPVVSPLVVPGSGTDFISFGLSPDGTRLYTGGSARSTTNPDYMLSLVIDLNAKQVVDAINLGPIQPDIGDKVVFSPDGKHVYYTLTLEQCMLVASTQTLQVVNEIPLSFEPIHIKLSHDGTRAFVAGAEPISHSVSCLAIVDLTTNNVVATVIGTTEYPPPCPGLAVCPDDSKAWLGSNNRVEIIDIDTASIIDDINLISLFTAGDIGAACPYVIAYSDDGSTVHVANFDANNYMIFDATTRELLHKMNVGFQPTDIVISPDGNEAYVLNSDSESISVINTITGEVVDTISLLILNPPPPK